MIIICKFCSNSSIGFWDMSVIDSQTWVRYSLPSTNLCLFNALQDFFLAAFLLVCIPVQTLLFAFSSYISSLSSCIWLWRHSLSAERVREYYHCSSSPCPGERSSSQVQIEFTPHLCWHSFSASPCSSIYSCSQKELCEAAAISLFSLYHSKR